MVKKMENPIKMDDLGGQPPIFGVDTHLDLGSHFPFPRISVVSTEFARLQEPYGSQCFVLLSGSCLIGDQHTEHHWRGKNG